ncbi:MAG: hypothetical protein RRZ85_01835 [Gordonibacter sp.]|uniref:hypothetical protein n=1 Tax=Gordonibacter sp. TaxID=1968902 RepID=UPI002FCBD1F8
MANTKGKVSRRAFSTKPEDVNTIEDLYDQVFEADLETLILEFSKLVDAYADTHSLHIGYAKLFLMDDDGKRVCDATYTARNA